MEKHQSIGHNCKDSDSGLLRATPVNKSLALKPDGFTSLLDALDYAAGGESGFNFYNQHGELESILSYSDLREQSMALAKRLLGLGCEHGDRVGIVAETNPMFHRFFFACLYAGLVPVALPAGVQLGARQAYVN
ncbi:MAG: AMP-binding protein, partial [Lysobacterales bacterium]